MGVVRKLSDYRKPHQEVMEQRVADTDDGYTRIANELLDSIMSNNFTVRQMKLLLAVIRKTYGFNKKFDWISGEQFSEMTGMPRTRCSSTKTELLNMKVLITDGRKVGINKVISDWCIERPERRREYGSTKHKAGYIYVFAEDENGPVKVGFTSRDAEERLKEVKYYFEGGNPKVFYVSPFNLHAGAVEPLVHQAMKGQMIRGEMFEATVTQAVNEINAVIESFTPYVTDIVTPSVNHDLHHEEHTKDNIQKKERNITQTHAVGLSLEEKLTPRQKGTNPRAKGTNPRSTMPAFDRERLRDTWNCKADKHGLPKIRNVSTTVESGLKRLWQSYLKQCKEIGSQPTEINTFLNGYLAHGYTPTKWACGDNPEGKRYGIETALRQEKIDEILSRED